MFTVKQIAIGGDERVWETDHVNFTPEGVAMDREVVRAAKAGAPTGTDTRACVDFASAGEHWEIKDGTVFVMNSHGATVSRWDLGASPVPLRDDVTGANAHLKARQTP